MFEPERPKKKIECWICKRPYEECECWIRCNSCGWVHIKEKKCNNPEHLKEQE